MNFNIKLTNSFHQQDVQPNKCSLKNKISTDMIVTIYLNQKNRKKRQQYGKFYRIQKTFFFKERILVYFMLNFLIQNCNSKERKVIQECQKIFLLFSQSIQQFFSNTKQSFLAKDTKEPIIYEFQHDILLKCQQKIESLFQKIEQKQRIVLVDRPLYLNQLQIFLDILMYKWTALENYKTQLLLDFQNIFKEKIIFQKIENAQKIIPLIVQLGSYNEADSSRTQKHLLYKNLALKIGNHEIVNIIETNQQKYVYFKLKSINAQSLNKITQLFKQNQRQKIIQSQQEKSQSDKNSQIVKDQQFYRISSKISTSCRKNSFNSGQKQGSIIDQKDYLLSTNILFQSNNGLSQNKIYCPISQIYTRSSSLQKTSAIIRDNVYTSIDLLAKFQAGSDNINYRRKKSCENPRHTSKIKMKDETKKMLKNPSNIQINLFDQAKANIFTQNFKSNHNYLLNYIPFEQISKKYTQITESRKNIIRNFFKQNMNNTNNSSRQ